MILEIRGVGFRNRGAELMLRAIADHYRPWGDRVELAMEPQGSYRQGAKYRLLTKLPPMSLSRPWLAYWMMPRAYKRALGIVTESRIGAVLDASGFAYSDQWGPAPSIVLARRAARWKAHGKRAILLPQAFGPFEQDRTARAMRRALESVDLVFARDRRSLELLGALGPAAAEVKLAPDFTNLVPGSLPEDFRREGPIGAVVPNVRMLDKTDPSHAGRYVGFLAGCVRELQRLGVMPVSVLHSGGSDGSLVDAVAREVGEPLRRIDESDPVRLKGILGACEVVVGSRFHALVGALSQAVPCLGLGWSHKYSELFAEYGCSEMLLSPHSEPQEAAERLRRALEPASRAELLARLRMAADRQKQAAQAMWADVDRLLGLTGCAAARLAA